MLRKDVEWALERVEEFIDCYERLYDFSVTKDYIEFVFGYEVNRQGDYRSVVYQIPWDVFYNDAKAQVDLDIIDRIRYNEEQQKKELEQERLRLLEEERERQEFERLKKKFGEDNV